MATPTDFDRIQGLIEEGEEILNSSQPVYVREHRTIDKAKFFSWRTRASNLLSGNYGDHELTKQFQDAVKVGPGSLTDHPLRQALKILRSFEQELRRSSKSSTEE